MKRFFTLLLLCLAHSTYAQFCSVCPNADAYILPDTYWQTTSAWIPTNGCYIFRVELIAGNTYTFKTGCGDWATASFDTEMTLFNPSCVLITSDDDGCSGNLSTITYTPTFSGDYFIRINAYQFTGGGSTQMAFRRDGGPDCKVCPNYDLTLSPTTNWQTHTSTVPAAGCKTYQFNAVAGTTYTFKTGCGDGATTNFASYLYIVDNNCRTLAVDSTCEQYRSTVTWTADYTGYAYLRLGQSHALPDVDYTLAYKASTGGGTPCTPPATTFASASPNAICEGSSALLNATNICTDCNYSWSPTTGIIGNPSQLIVYAAPSTTTTYTMTASNGCGTPTSASVTVTVNTMPPTPTITQNGTTLICNEPGYTYKWFLLGTFTGATGQSYTPPQNGHYSVEITDANGCSSTSNSIYLGTVGMEDNETSFQIYPNPNTGLFTISSEGRTLENAQLTIRNTLGQVIYAETLGTITGSYKKEINLAGISAGTYTTELMNTEQRMVKILVIGK